MAGWLALAALSLALAGCRDGNRWIARLGYTPINPPSTLLQPGALLMNKRGNNTGVRLVCSAEESLGANFTPSSSKTINGKFHRSKKAGFHVSADVLSEVNAAANTDAVTDVYVEVQNAVVVHITDTDVLRAIRNRSDACRLAIERRRAAGWDISLVKSALVGDVAYRVSYSQDANLDASAKLATVQQISVTLGGNIQSVTEDQASATGLIWGIRDDEYLAAIDADDVDVKRLKRRSILPAGQVLQGGTPVPATATAEQPDPMAALTWCPIAIDDAQELGQAQPAQPAVQPPPTTAPGSDMPAPTAPRPQRNTQRGRPGVGDGGVH